jgi:hypothetical protein
LANPFLWEICLPSSFSPSPQPPFRPHPAFSPITPGLVADETGFERRSNRVSSENRLLLAILGQKTTGKMVFPTGEMIFPMVFAAIPMVSAANPMAILPKPLAISPEPTFSPDPLTLLVEFRVRWRLHWLFLSDRFSLMTRPGSALAAALWLISSGTLLADELTLTSPLDYQVVQRNSQNEGTIDVRGNLPPLAASAMWQARLVDADGGGDWQPFAPKPAEKSLSGSLKAKAGGWYRLELRGSVGGNVVAAATVPHVGIGEVFVVAGQSNSANYGEEKQNPQTGRVAAFDGKLWQLANDPQPGAGGKSGSLMPPLGDELVQRLGVPVGFVACGIGATSVREWLPKGATFPNPPTIESRVEKLPDGAWASKGAAYDAFIARIKPFCPDGFRAVLWHQGESDANQRDPSRTLPGKLYSEYLEKLIRDSRRDTGFLAPWFVAQASYHVPGDEGSDDIRAAQASLWRDGLAHEGPDSDALKGPLRERNGTGVHFSGPGLRAHAAKWAEKIIPWLLSQ